MQSADAEVVVGLFGQHLHLGDPCRQNIAGDLRPFAGRNGQDDGTAGQQREGTHVPRPVAGDDVASLTGFGVVEAFDVFAEGGQQLLHRRNGLVGFQIAETGEEIVAADMPQERIFEGQSAAHQVGK